jgi:ABC-2 type transport system ATP-binding protein
MDTLLSVDGLAKHFGPIRAVDGIGFEVERGEVLGFLGPNGAGKSTTMRMIAGYLAPSAGRVTVAGFDVVRQPIEVLKRLGYLPEGAPAYGEMTPASILAFAAGMRRMGPDTRRERIDEMVARLELEDVLQQPIETLSKGFKRRVGLALALLHDPDLLILDEPTDGLDPNQKHHVRTLLADLAASKAIIISTHILEEVDALCTRAIVIARGRIVADARPSDLLSRSAWHGAVSLKVPAARLGEIRQAVAGVAGVGRVETLPDGEQDARVVAFPEAGCDVLVPVRGAVERAGLKAPEIHVERGRLDDVFRRLTAA